MTNAECRKSMDEKADDVRARVAESLESAADSVRAVANESARAINDLASQAGKKLDSTATCARTFARGDMLGGLRKKVNMCPLKSLAVATAVGLIAGVALRRSR
jgi:ElaB/YqjD/DUF883 family membrane-anchored ribosome-binding protein